MTGCSLPYSSNPHLSKIYYDRFFGKGNWKVTDSEAKEGPYTPDDSYFSRDNTSDNSYTLWTVEYTDPDGDEIDAKIDSDNSLETELEDIALYYCAKKIKNDIASKVYSEEDMEDGSFDFVRINDNDKHFHNLMFQKWFTLDQVSTEHFLEYSDDFYIEVHTELPGSKTKDDVKSMQDKAEKLSELLLQEYGEHATFEIYFSCYYNDNISDAEAAEYNRYIAYYKGEKVPDGTDLTVYMKDQ